MRKITLFGLCFLLVLFAAGCATTTNIFDENIPLENTAELSISQELTVKTYNGIPVKLKTGLFSNTGFTIPAGSTTLVIDLDTGRQQGNIRYRAQNVTVTYNFEAGKEYLIRFWFADDEGNVNRTNVGRGTPGILIHQGDFHRYVHKVDLSRNR